MALHASNHDVSMMLFLRLRKMMMVMTVIPVTTCNGKRHRQQQYCRHPARFPSAVHPSAPFNSEHERLD
jgi:hypothetical protein